MREVFKEGFGVGHVINQENGNLSVKWVENNAITTESEDDLSDFLLD